MTEGATPTARHLTLSELEAGLEAIRRAPRDGGVIELIVRRPDVDEREILEEAVLDRTLGVVGDTWGTRNSSRSADGGPHPEAQVNIVNARAIALIAHDRDRWALAGDQFYVDMDISQENLPAGTRLALGTAILEVSALPHTGCSKYSKRFGSDATKFVNSSIGRSLNLRGINTWVVQPGVVRIGDRMMKIQG